MGYMRDVLGRRLDSFVVQDQNAKSLRARSLLSGDPQGQAPTFTKWAGNPLLTKAQTTAESITWCSILKVEGLLTSPRGRYYVYYATDHAPNADATLGIYLAWFNQPGDPWTNVGRVYQYGSPLQTETPSAIWDPVAQKIRIFFQEKQVAGGLGEQTTLQTSSADGETGWSTAAIALDVPSTTAFPGDGHTGYLRPFRWGGQLVGYHLRGGKNNPHAGIAYSRDHGVTWVMDPRPLGYGYDVLDDATQRIDWLQCAVVEWRGQPWYIGAKRPPTSGGTEVPATWIAAPLTPDLRQFAAPAVNITPPAQTWENSKLGSPLSVISENGRLYLFYRGNGRLGGFGMAVSEVSDARP